MDYIITHEGSEALRPHSCERGLLPDGIVSTPSHQLDGLGSGLPLRGFPEFTSFFNLAFTRKLQ